MERKPKNNAMRERYANTYRMTGTCSLLFNFSSTENISAFIG